MSRVTAWSREARGEGREAHPRWGASLSASVLTGGEPLHLSSDLRGNEGAGVFTATLKCGAELAYEVRSFLPAAGATVPCRHHGYCAVEATGSGRLSDLRRLPFPRATRRTQGELLAWLQSTSVTTVNSLRRQRFTLRMIAAAERDGVIDVDLLGGTVVLRSPAAPRQMSTAPRTH